MTADGSNKQIVARAGVLLAGGSVVTLSVDRFLLEADDKGATPHSQTHVTGQT